MSDHLEKIILFVEYTAGVGLQCKYPTDSTETGNISLMDWLIMYSFIYGPNIFGVFTKEELARDWDMLYELDKDNKNK